MPTFDLNKPVLNLDNEPMDSGETFTLERPTDLTLPSGQVVEGVAALTKTGGKALTYHRMIRNAVSADLHPNHPKYSKFPEMDARIQVLSKLVADTDVYLDPEEDIPTILKAARVALSTVQNMRLKELFDGAEDEPGDKAKDFLDQNA